MAPITGNFTVNVKAGTPPPPDFDVEPQEGAEPQETEGVAVADDLVCHVTGGTPPYNFTLGGALPPGVALDEKTNPDGSVDVVLSGTPEAGSAGDYDFSVTVNDSSPQTAGASATARRKIQVSR